MATVRPEPRRLIPMLSAILCGTLLLILAWRRLFLSGQIPLDGNMIALSYPNWSLAHALWHSPHLPLWNPARNLGEPHLADPQTMALYPPQLLLSALPDFGDYLRAWIFLHTALAAAFAGLLARRWYKDPAAAAVAAALAGFNGFFMARATFPNHFAAAAWLPAEAYFLELGSPLGLGVCLALQWLAGFPPLVCVSAAGLAVMAAGKGRAGIRCLVLGGAVALGLSAIQWAPFLEFLGLSNRSALLASGGAAQYALPLGQALKEFLVPQWYAVAPSLAGDPAIVSYYTGVAALALAAWAAWSGRGRERLLLAAGLAAAALSLSAATPILSFIPPLRAFRFPSNWLLLTAGATALLAAAGTSRLKASWRWPAAALIALDLLAFAQPAKTAWALPGFLQDPPLLALRAGPGRLYHENKLMSVWQRGYLQSAADYSAMREFLAPSFATAFGLQEVSSYQVLRLRTANAYAKRLDSPDRERLLNEAGVDTVVALAPGAERVSAESLHVLPRAGAFARVFAVGAKPGSISLTAYAPGFVHARADLPAKATVVLAETDYPGWKVLLDGREIDHGRFEGAFVAAEVPAGPHDLVFRFGSPRFLWGACVSAATLALILLLAHH
jgi:hypothetical protein